MEVNKIIARTLAICTLILVAVIVCDLAGIFEFSVKLRGVILVVGFLATIMPSVLMHFKISDDFLRYYMMIALALFIGLMGTSNSIGIYITYVLVPIASCLYLDRKFTLWISLFSYITMTFGVFFNTAGKMEVIYLNWSHLVAFRNYMIGFTLEYIAIMLFIYQVIKRSQEYLDSQLSSLISLQEENEKQERVSAIYSRTMSKQKRTAFDMIINESDSLTTECYARLAVGHQFVAGIQDLLMYSSDFERDMDTILAQIGEYFELDRIMYIDGKEGEENVGLHYQWGRDERLLVKDFQDFLPDEGFASIAARYDANGYIELYNDETELERDLKDIDSPFTRYIATIMLGAQLWVPTVVAGEYSGALCFDRFDMTRYSVVDKFLLAEVAGVLAAQINRHNSEYANRAKSTFLSNMSHEIRTPMNAILGLTQVSLREEMPDQVRRNLNVIRSSAEGLLGIINDILDFSKIESGKIDIIEADYSMLSVLNDLITIITARNEEKQLDLVFDIPEDLPKTLRGDAVRIKQVMVNLATNAIKYTDSGSVTVSVRVAEKESGISFHYSVIDTGQGIRESDRDKLFRSFSQIDRQKNHNVEGTGLGLAISKQLIELMGGTIGFQSEYGIGSEFYFDLPQNVVDPAPAGPISEYEYEDKEQGPFSFSAPWAHIMIVDDNEMNLMVAEALFEPYGMKITTATGGMAALGLVQKERFDLIFMDHFMPEMDGVEATHAIRALEGNPNQHIPIVALTADALVEVKAKLLNEGMDDFLAKPIDMKQAVKVLRRFLGEEKREV